MAARLILSLLLLLGACSPASDAAQGEGAAPTATPGATTTDRASLGGGEAVLVTQGGGCVLRRAGQADLPLAPAPPCRFLRADGQVQRHAYPDRAIDAVVMVVGTPADAAAKAHFGVAAASTCGTVAQGLIVRGERVSAAPRPLRGAMVCIDQGRDEKDFRAAADAR